MTCGESSLSFADLDQQSSRLAGALRAQGVTANDAVALHLRNSVEYVVADLAILKLGAAKSPLNELMSPNELGFCLAHAGAKILIRHASLPEPDFGSGRRPACIVVQDTAGDIPAGALDWNTVLETAPPPDAQTAPDPVAPDTRAILSYTGGTTGTPKCVVHNQGRMAINLLAHVVCGDIRSDEVMLLTTPLPHSAGYHMQACLFAGGHVVLEQKFDPQAVRDICDRHQVTWTFAVPTMLYRLIDSLPEGTRPPPSLRTIVYGAAPMSKARIEQGLALFGPVFIQLYGQTECPNYITTLSKDDHLDADLLRSCGRPVPFCDVDIVGEDGAPVPAGEVGEIVTASPYLFVEYHDDPQQTARTLVDGRLRTGDLAYRNADGFLFLVDRAKDMIITGGMNVYSVEVEAAIRQHPAVRDVAVIGVPHPDWGEAVTAVIVSESDIPHDELKAFLTGRVSVYKLPKTIHRAEALPLTPYGKIDKKALRQLYSPAPDAPAPRL